MFGLFDDIDQYAIHEKLVSLGFRFNPNDYDPWDLLFLVAVKDEIHGARTSHLRHSGGSKYPKR